MSQSQHVQKLSATKQRLSLGEVKKAEKQKAKAANSRKVIRTTVVNSSEFEWPVISPEDEKELTELLTRDLKCLRLPGYRVPLGEIRKVKKEERRDFRHKWLTQKYLEIGFNFTAYSKLREDVLLGVNRISTTLEQNVGVSCIIVEKDVDPPLLTKLLVPLANSKGIPIIGISGLNAICKETFNTRCIALGLKENCGSSNHSLHHIFRLAISISEKQETTAESLAVSQSVSETKGGNKSIASKGKNAKRTSTTPRHFQPPKIRRV